MSFVIISVLINAFILELESFIIKYYFFFFFDLKKNYTLCQFISFGDVTM